MLNVKTQETGYVGIMITDNKFKLCIQGSKYVFFKPIETPRLQGTL